MKPSPTTRRMFLQRGGALSAAALLSLLNDQVHGSGLSQHHRPTAKRVIFLHQSGAPSQLDLFDYKAKLEKLHGEDLPESVRQGQRLTSMTAQQARKRVTASKFAFRRRGQSGAYVSDLLPHTAGIVDHVCLIRSMYTEAINHDPAITFMQTGSSIPGRPSFGSWLNYGLGSENSNLPAFIVMLSGGRPGDQPLFNRLWSAGFLPSQHQGVRFRAGRDPVLFLSNPPGITGPVRERVVAGVRALNQLQAAENPDPEIQSRIKQYETAFGMQKAIPAIADLSDEPQHTFDLYGEDARKPGTYAANCLMARRLAERGVRFIQLYHRGWDHHLSLPSRIVTKCKETDQSSAALVVDLKQRGLLDDTLVVWAGEFGRTAYCQGKLTADDYGRDHHPRCFTIWLAGGGIRSGLSYGKTDDFSYNVVANPVHVHDLHATILHCLGIDHRRLTYRHQGRDYRLTDIAGKVVPAILA